jgi:hypothetical protein
MYLRMTFDESSTLPIEELFTNALLQVQKINGEENRVQIKAMLNK